MQVSGLAVKHQPAAQYGPKDMSQRKGYSQFYCLRNPDVSVVIQQIRAFVSADLLNV